MALDFSQYGIPEDEGALDFSSFGTPEGEPEPPGIIDRVKSALTPKEQTAPVASADEINDTAQPAVEAPAIPDRSWGEVATDTGISLRKGGASVLKSAGFLSDMMNPITALQRISGGDTFNKEFASSLENVTKEIEEGYSAKRKAQGKAYDATDGFVETAQFLLQNPSYVGDLAAESAVGTAVAGVAGRVAGTAMGALENKIAQQAAEKGAAWASGAAEAAQALGQVASDIEKRLDANGVTDSRQRALALSASIPAGIATLVFGRMGGSVESKLLGKGFGEVGENAIKVVGKDLVKEAGEEFFQSGGEQFFTNLGQRTAGDQIDLSRGVAKAAATGGIVGAAQGGGISAARATVDAIVPGAPPAPPGASLPETPPESGPDTSPVSLSDVAEVLQAGSVDEAITAAASNLETPADSIPEVSQAAIPEIAPETAPPAVLADPAISVEPSPALTDYSRHQDQTMPSLVAALKLTRSEENRRAISAEIDRRVAKQATEGVSKESALEQVAAATGRVRGGDASAEAFAAQDAARAAAESAGASPLEIMQAIETAAPKAGASLPESGIPQQLPASGEVSPQGAPDARAVEDAAYPPEPGNRGYEAEPVDVGTTPAVQAEVEEAPGPAGRGLVSEAAGERQEARPLKEVLAAKAADDAQWRERLSAMPPEEAAAASERAIEHNDVVELEAVERFFGAEQRAAFEALKRRAKNAWLDANATDEMQDYLNERQHPEDLIKEYSQAAFDFDTTSPRELGRSIAVLSRDIDKPGFMQSPAGTTFRNAMQFARSEGWNLDDVVAGMRERGAQWAGNDAPELFARLFREAQPAAQQPAMPRSAPQLPAPAAEKATTVAESATPVQESPAFAEREQAAPTEQPAQSDQGETAAQDRQRVDGRKKRDRAPVAASSSPMAAAATALRSAAEAIERSVAPKQEIADFGEKIGGARKDVWQSLKDDMDAAQRVDVAAEPLSKSWPTPNYQALLDSGADAWAVAFMHAARDAIPPKPRTGWKVRSWATLVTQLRDLTMKLADGTATIGQESVLATLKRMDTSRAVQDIAGRIELYQLVGHEKSLEGVRISSSSYSLFEGKNYDPPKVFWTVEKDVAATAFSNWPRMLSIGETKEEALAKFKAAYPTLEITKPASKEVSFDIFSKRGENGYWIGKKIGRNPILLEGPFANIKEARTFKAENQAALVAKLEKAKEIPSERRETNEPRVGVDMRNGQDVTPEMFGETFGFRGVEFGNWVEQGKRQQDLNDAFDALMDMAAILGVPPKAISLNGELGLAFGARGSGGINPAKAHYESGFVVINLTKKDGAGSIGHEWWHALDNYFSRMRSDKDGFLTEALDVSLAARQSNYAITGAVRKEMIDAFGKVVRAIKDTALKARSSRLDSKRSKDYWTTGREMAARAFESYLISKLQDQNASNDYLANIVDEATWKAAESMGFELDDSYPYPTAGEIPGIRAGFEHFFSTIQSKETDKGVALFSRKGQFKRRPGQGIDIEDGKALARTIKLAFPIHAVETRAKWPDAVLRDVNEAPHPEDISGAFRDGEIWLDLSAFTSLDDLQHVILHEGWHGGWRAIFGDDLDPVLVSIYQTNPNVKAAVAEFRSKYPDMSVVRSTEEVLVDMGASGEAKNLKGWRKLVAGVKEWLRRHGFTASFLEKFTDDDVLYLLGRAGKVAAGEARKPSDSGYSSVFARQDGRTEKPRSAPQPADKKPLSASGPIDSLMAKLGGEALAKRLTIPVYDRIVGLGRFVPERVKAGLVADYGLPQEYLDRRTETKIQQRKGAKQAERTVALLGGLDRGQSRVAYQWMTQREATGDTLLEKLPESEQAILRDLKDHITELGREAVALGQLAPESFERNKMAYLHRTYGKFEMEDTKQQQFARSRAIKILGEQYRGRGLIDQAEPGNVSGKPEKGKKYIRVEKAGESKYFPATGPVPAKYAEWRRDAAEWEVRYPAKKDGAPIGMWRDFTEEERKRMGELDEVRFAVAKTLLMMTKDIETGRLLQWVGENYGKDSPDGLDVVDTPTGRGLESFKAEQWVQVPTANIPGTQVKTFGELAGKYIPAPMWNDIRQVATAKFNPFGEVYGSILRGWKISKTALSPAVHANNIMSNVILADMADIGGDDMYRAAKIFVQAKLGKDETAQRLLARYDESGGELGSYALTELQNKTLEPLLAAMRKEIEGKDAEAGRVIGASFISDLLRGRASWREMTERAKSTRPAKIGVAGAKAMIALYQSEDQFFRFATWYKAVSEGRTDVEAGTLAREAFLNYEINAPWVANLRATVLPFIAFSYRAVPLVLKAAAEKPWKLAKYAAVAGSLNAMGYAALGLGGADEERERKLLPDEKSGKLWGVFPRLVRLPWNTDETGAMTRADGAPAFLDIRRWIPVGDVIDFGQREPAVPIPASLYPGGPLVIFAEIVLNKQAFNAQPIVLETDSPAEQAEKFLDYMFKTFAPNVPLPNPVGLAAEATGAKRGFLQTYSMQNILNAGRGVTDAFGRELSLRQAIEGSVGVKEGSYPADVLMKNLRGKLDHDIMELDLQFSKIKRQYSRNGLTDAEFDSAVEKHVSKKQKLIEEFQKKLD